MPMSSILMSLLFSMFSRLLREGTGLGGQWLVVPESRRIGGVLSPKRTTEFQPSSRRPGTPAFQESPRGPKRTGFSTGPNSSGGGRVCCFWYSCEDCINENHTNQATDLLCISVNHTIICVRKFTAANQQESIYGRTAPKSPRTRRPG